MNRLTNEKIAGKIVALLADSRISSTDWKNHIPTYITEHNKFVVAKAKALADGINEQLEEQELGLPIELVVDYQYNLDREKEIENAEH
jgi:hypothetical protein